MISIESSPVDARRVARGSLRRVVLAILLLAGSVAAGAAEEPNPLTLQGQSLAKAMCAGCHAIGSAGTSPHASAPPFHRLGNLIDLDAFMERLREGLMTGHPDMPAFRFTREDARALVAYVRTVQGR